MTVLREAPLPPRPAAFSALVLFDEITNHDRQFTPSITQKEDKPVYCSSDLRTGNSHQEQPAEAMPTHLDAHAKPPDDVRKTYKMHAKRPEFGFADGLCIDTEYDSEDDRLRKVDAALLPSLPATLRQTFADFLSDSPEDDHGDLSDIPEKPEMYAVPRIPGLYIYPSLLPPPVQLRLLEKLFHRDLSNSEHKTNVHMHYEVPYPPSGASFFSPAASDLSCLPNDPELHKPIPTKQLLNKKLRWMTLGGQYDWTRKVYPDGPPPPFPEDIATLIEGLFPMKAEAAIVNLYSPGDKLSLHRDVSEECDQPLASISIGCDGVFVIGLEPEGEGVRNRRCAVIRLRCGDAVVMSGKSRYAWHAVPAVLEDTCPEWMRSWPGEQFADWEGWMSGKRINLNVRQMFD